MALYPRAVIQGALIAAGLYFVNPPQNGRLVNTLYMTLPEALMRQGALLSFLHQTA